MTGARVVPGGNVLLVHAPLSRKGRWVISMRKARTRRRPLLASVIVAMVGLLMASPAAWAALKGDWHMDSPPDTSEPLGVIDSSTSNNHGTATDVDQGVEETIVVQGVPET